MEISSLLPNSDNIYKFLFMGGIFMIVFSFLYPLEKRQKIEIETISLKESVAIQTFDMSRLKNRIDSMKKELEPTIKKLENAKKIPDMAQRNAAIEAIKKQYNQDFDISKQREIELKINQISNHYASKKIMLLEEHIESFKVFQHFFLIIGPFFVILGLFGWFKAVRISEKIQKMQSIKIERELDIVITNQKTPFCSVFKKRLMFFRAKKK